MNRIMYLLSQSSELNSGSQRKILFFVNFAPFAVKMNKKFYLKLLVLANVKIIYGRLFI